LKNGPDNKVSQAGFRGIVAAASVLLIIFGVSLWGSQKSKDARYLVVHTHEVQTALSQVLSTLQDAETGQRGFLLTSEKTYLEPYIRAINKLPTSVDRVRQLTLDV
jgi:CHASE3 domain sensor protein